MDRESELALVARLRAGDTGAFDEIFDAYRAPVFAFLLRLARRRDVAEDLLEEVWLRLVTHASRLDPETRLAAWLFTVARNLFWSYCRSRALQLRTVDGLIGLWPTPAPPASPFDLAAGHELDTRVERALASLPPMYREALLLVSVRELTPSEAAAALGITPEALRQRLSRARAMLSAELDHLGRVVA